MTKFVSSWLLLLLAVTCVHGQYTYTTNNGSITITGYTGPGGSVTIPTMLGGLPVTAIGDATFANLDNITNLVIPDGILSVGNAAFALENNLKNVQISATVSFIGDLAFLDCPNLLAINVNAQNPFYSSVQGALCDGTKTKLIELPAVPSDNYAIPDGITSIDQNAFASSANLTNLYLPASVSDLSEGPFQLCGSLLTFTVEPANQNFTSVDGVLFTKNLNELLQYPLGRKGPYLVPQVGQIGPYAFAGAAGLTELTIPSVTTISGGAFVACSSLLSIYLPASLTSLDYGAFNGDSSLTNIEVNSDNQIYSSSNGALLDKSQKNLIIFPVARTGIYYVPSTVTNIVGVAFANASLTGVVLPAGLINIEAYAFGYCYNLLSVTFNGPAPSIDPTAFAGDNNAVLIYPPNAPGWNNVATNTGVPTAKWNGLIQTTATTGFGVNNNQFGLNIAGATNLTLVVESTTNLASGVWTPLQTVILTNGSYSYIQPINPNIKGTFFRLTTP